MTKQTNPQDPNHNPTLKEWMDLFDKSDPKTQEELLKLASQLGWNPFKKEK